MKLPLSVLVQLTIEGRGQGSSHTYKARA